MDATVDLHGFRAVRVRAIRCNKCNYRLDTRNMAPLTRLACPDCGRTLYVPARVGDYLLMRLLGRGGMGSVYGAWDTVLNRPVALKVMLPPDGQEVPDWATLEAEARSAAMLNHPNIAQVYTFGYYEGQPYFVMELARGRQFDDFFDKEHPLDARFAFTVALQMALGLEQAAERKLLHSDIKPENIMIGDSPGGAKLVDFGLAGTAGTGSGAASKVVWGSPHYVAPERLRRKAATLRSDMYSLGATLYHALTGSTPFKGEEAKDVMMARLSTPPPRLRELRPDLPAEAEALILRMMSVEPGQRHPTYASLTRDIREVLAALGGEIKLDEHARERLRFLRDAKNIARTQGMLSGTMGVSHTNLTGAAVKEVYRLKFKHLAAILAGLLFLGGAVYGSYWAWGKAREAQARHELEMLGE